MAPGPIAFDDAVGSLDIASLTTRYAEHSLTPRDVIEAVYDRIEAYADPAVFLALVSRADALAAAEALGGFDGNLALWGIPVAVKDNIDVAGLPTTVACPDAGYLPAVDAPAVAALRAAGAIVIGKTNLDQWATGLNGTRSPAGTPRNPWRSDLIPGGSSSGSGVAVAAGLVSAALGTDTAGSGRVPAAMGSIVGLKPSRGLVSARGVYPACASLDCVSVFALTVADAALVASCFGPLDLEDPYSRPLPPLPAVVEQAALRGVRLAVPAGVADDFFGDVDFSQAWRAVLGELAAQGVTLIELDLSDFYRAGTMLYGGAWLAERYAALQPVLDSRPEAVEPSVRAIVSAGAQVTAGEVFASLRELEGLRRDARSALSDVDALLVPTVGGVFTVEQMRSDPVALNQRLGRFTTFTNLLDLAAIAVPAAVVGEGAHSVPFGVTLQAPAGADAKLAALGAAIESLLGLTLGATHWPPPVPLPVPVAVSYGSVSDPGDGTAVSLRTFEAAHAPGPGPVPPPAPGPGHARLAVVGAHLRGQPLNGQLRDCGAAFVRAAHTAPEYRLVALPHTVPPKPGLVREASAHGRGVEVEVYDLPFDGLGRFVAAIPSPLGIGTVTLADGESCLGFLCEEVATRGAADITAFGGWRNYLESL